MKLREEARAWLQRVLESEFAGNAEVTPHSLTEYGDSLFAIAESFQIPDESLHFWLGDRPRGKDWSLSAWRAWCAKYAAAAASLPPEVTGVAPSAPEERILCTHCWANLVLRQNGSFWCPKCGVIQLPE